MTISLRISIILSILVLFSSSLLSQDKYQVGLIGFYNFENLFDTIDQDFVRDEEFTPDGSRTYTGEVYKDKLSKLSKVVSEIGEEHSSDGLAILGVAEIENRRVLNDFVKQKSIKDKKYKIVHYDSKDRRGIDVALLYNPKYFRVVKSEKITVTDPADSNFKTRDVLYVKGLFLGDDMNIFVSHWPSRRGGEEATMHKRCNVGRAIRKKSDEILAENKDANIIVMGDFNDDPNNKSVVECLKTVSERHMTIEEYFFNPFFKYHKKGIGTLAYRESWNLFDQIVVSRNLVNPQSNMNLVKGYIFSKSWMKTFDGIYKGYPKRTYSGNLYQGGYSDHFPTFIKLKKKVK